MYLLLKPYSQQFSNLNRNADGLFFSSARTLLKSAIDKGKLKLKESVHIKSALCLACLIWSSTPYIASSQPLIEELQRLNFGTLAVSANTSVSRFIFPQSGSGSQIEGQFFLVAAGTPGSYRLSGFPAFTPLSVTLDDSTLTVTEVGISESLTVDDYEVSQPTTNAQGNAEVSLGARLNTSGNGNGYGDDSYSGNATLRIEYWQPEANAYVFNSRLIDMETELRSTIALSEEQQLNFGTLFARTSSTEQAVLNLTPAGAYSITEPLGTRLVVLSNPEQGVIKVSGAAPFNFLTISSQSTDVLLQHAEFPESAPHLILSDLVTSPDATGRLDANGELVISVGGTLRTELTESPVVYPSGVYEGIYELTVSY